MTPRISLIARWSLLCVLIVASCPAAWADPVAPGPNDRNTVLTVVSRLKSEHLSRHPLDAEISERCLSSFLKALDPMKVYFYQSDIDEFMKHRDELSDAIRKGDIGFAYTVFRTFLQRVDERVKTVNELLAGPLDFTADEQMVVDRDTAVYPNTAAEAARSLAAADQVRHPRAEVGRQRRQERGPGGTRQVETPLQQLRQAHAPDQQRRVAGDVPQRLHHVVRSAHRLHVARHAEELRNRHEPGAGRNRRVADERRRLHFGEEDHSRRRRGQRRPHQAGRQDHRRGPERRGRNRRRSRHETQRRRQADSRQAGHESAPRGDARRRLAEENLHDCPGKDRADRQRGAEQDLRGGQEGRRLAVPHRRDRLAQLLSRHGRPSIAAGWTSRAPPATCA